MNTLTATALPFTLMPETPADRPAVEALLDDCFGIDRRTKTSYRFREGEEPVPGLSFVARGKDGSLVGAISFWHLRIGKEGTPALLLGPLAVSPRLQNKGIGRALMAEGLAKAKALGHRLVILVGDEPYYGRVGFRKLPEDRLVMPGPVNPDRFLYIELEPGSLGPARGLVLPPARFAALKGMATAPRGTTSAPPVREAAQG